MRTNADVYQSIGTTPCVRDYCLSAAAVQLFTSNGNGKCRPHRAEVRPIDDANTIVMDALQQTCQSYRPHTTATTAQEDITSKREVFLYLSYH